jgi:hypothetical protein
MRSCIAGLAAAIFLQKTSKPLSTKPEEREVFLDGRIPKAA